MHQSWTLTALIVLLGLAGERCRADEAAEHSTSGMQQYVTQEVVEPEAIEASRAIRAKWDACIQNELERSARSRLDNFAGFIEGRLQVEPPEWWMADLRRRLVRVDGMSFVNRLPQRWTRSRGGYLTSGLDNAFGMEELTITSGVKRIELRREQFSDCFDSNDKWSGGAISGSYCDGMWVVAPFIDPGTLCGPCPLYGVNDSDGKVLWSRSMYCEWTGAIGGFVYGQYLEVSLNERCVACWRSSDFGISVQVFDRANGKVLGLFSTGDTLPPVPADK